MAAATRIHLFEVEPDLLERVPEAERHVARRSVVVAAHRVSLGAWHAEDVGSPSWGVLIVDGLIAREVGLAGTTAAELLGAGDVVLSGGGESHEVMVAAQKQWTVLEPATLAVLDDRFMPVVRRWPEIAAALMQRGEARADRLALTEAISHLTRVDTRVLAMLWLLADRWGRVGPEGTVLPLRLTHRTLARLIGARRPSVTSAVTDLCRRGLMARRPDGSWLLYGPPPVELERAATKPAILAAPAPASARRSPSRAPGAARGPHVGERMRALAEGYETQARLARSLGERARATQERASVLQDEAAERRVTAAIRPAPRSR